MTDCRVCEVLFVPARMGQIVCSVRCAQRMPVIARNTIKAAKKMTRAKLAALKPRSKWMAEAQQAFNAWVRARDAWVGCVSCGTMTGKTNAGHYRSVGSCPELRFDPLNVHRQCERCNTYLHGNLIAYRHALIRRVGIDSVNAIEGPHPAQKHTVEELRAIRDLYRAKSKAIERKFEAPPIDGGL